jgi:septal ring factor EnvC (AmiA/AmiB activator)
MDEETKEILKQVNRRLMNTESSIRVIEQRIDVVEGTIKAIERKIGRNTQDITEFSRDNEGIERLREDVIKLEACVEGLASKSDVEAIRKYLDLASPADEK